MENQSENGRVRAWVLVEADDAPRFARQLYKALGHAGGDEYVLVRADLVKHAHYNVIVPVDAKNPEALRMVVKQIAERVETKSISIAEVLGHNPKPAHDAHGFITAEEKAAGRDPEDPCVEVGRFPKSPGFNAWG
jgi:DNA-binding Lrp family transcriptional regulator